MEIEGCDKLEEISNMDIGGDLKLERCSSLSVLSKLQIARDLNITGCPIRVFSDDVCVERNISIDHSDIQLPSPFFVKGDLYLSLLEIPHLPEELSVGGSLIIHSCQKIKFLPDKIKIGKSLDLSYTAIESLPDSLNDIQGDLILIHSRIRRLPPNLKLKGRLHIKGYEIKEIPEGINLVQTKEEVKELSFQKNEDFSAFLIEEQLVSKEKLRTDGNQLIIDSNLDLSEYQVESLHVNVWINGDLSLKGLKNIKEISGSITINGNLNMSYTEVESFNASVIVNGNIDLDEAKIKNLPEKLVVGGDLYIVSTKGYERLPDEIEVKGNFGLKNDQHLKLPRKITVGKDADINTPFLEGLEEIYVKGNLNFYSLCKRKHTVKDMIVGGNLDLSFFNYALEIQGNVVVAGNLNLAYNKDFVETGNIKIGKRLIRKNSYLNEQRLKIVRKAGYLPGGMFIECSVRFGNEYLDDLNIKKIGNNVKIYGNVTFSRICVEEVGSNFTVYGNLELEEAFIKKVGLGLTVYGDVTMIKSQISPVENPNITGKLTLDETDIELLGDVKIGQYIEEVAGELKVDQKLIVKNAYLYRSKIKKIKEEGYLPDHTSLEGGISFSGQNSEGNWSINKIGNHITIHGDVKFSNICIEEIGSNFTVWGNLILEEATIKKIGQGLTVYGDVIMIKSQISPVESPDITGKLTLDETNMEFSGDIKIGQYIYKINSNVMTAGDCLIIDYNDFITEFREHIGAEEYLTKREVEEYFSLDLEIRRLINNMEISKLTDKILSLETRSLAGKFVEILYKIYKMVDEEKLDPDNFYEYFKYNSWDYMVESYQRIVFDFSEGIVKCSLKMHKGEEQSRYNEKIEEITIDTFKLDGYKELKEEIDSIQDEKTRENYAFLLELVTDKVLIRDFALSKMNERMNEIKRWGEKFACRMCYKFLNDDGDLGDAQYTLEAYLRLKRGEFSIVIGDCYERPYD